MRMRLFLFIILIAGIIAISCNKDPGPIGPDDEVPPPDPTTGTLIITTTPTGAAITLNDTLTGDLTPHTYTDLWPGYYDFELTLNNYNTGYGWVTVVAGDITVYDTALTVICPGNIIGDPNGIPEIHIIGLDPGESTVSGTANNINAQEAQVVLYALTNQWYVQPWIADPWTAICGDGRWSSWTHPWNRMVALLVDETFSPPSTLITHPSFLPGVIAWDEYPSAHPPLQFGGQTWGIKVSADPFDPGPNYWSDTTDNVWVDGDGLHLRIVYDGNRWTCSEVHLIQSLGYGTYTFVIASRVDNLDLYAVVAPFLYENPAREIDIEFAGDALIPGQVNAQYVIQPYNTAGNMYRFTMPATGLSTHRFVWQGSGITFESWEGDGDRPADDADLIAYWVYTGTDNPPPGGERLHINTWLFGGHAPQSGVGDELIIRSFTFVP